MSTVLPESELPAELSAFAAVDAAYPAELTRCYDALRRRLAVLIECEKELAPYVYRSIRDRLKGDNTRCLYLDGRASADLPPPPQGATLVMSMIHQIREVVRGAVGERIVVLPHLDILGASGGGGMLNAESRELIPLLYENPEVLWLGFKDQFKAVASQERFQHSAQCTKDVLNLKMFRLDLGFSGFHFCQIQQIIDQFRKLSARSLNGANLSSAVPCLNGNSR